MTELLPCPLCASTNVSDGICFVGDKSASEPAVRCADCGCRATLAAWLSRTSAQQPSTVNELAAWLVALEDASMYEPVPASLVEHGRRYIRAGLTQEHAGDCTGRPHSCVVCGTTDAIDKAKQVLTALALTEGDRGAEPAEVGQLHEAMDLLHKARLSSIHHATDKAALRKALEHIAELYIRAPGFAAPDPTTELVYGMYRAACDALRALGASTVASTQSPRQEG